MEPGEQAELRARTERWFIWRGLPHFIDSYSITGDVLTRALPFLILVVVLEAFNTFSEDRGGAAEIAPFFIGLGLMLAVWIAINLLRRRRPLQRPDRVGGIELAFYLLVPPIFPAIFHDDKVVDSAGIVVLNLFLLAAAYVVTSYGLIPMTRWGIRQLFGQLGDLANLLARAFPLMLLFATVLFLTVENWEISSDPNWFFYTLVIGLMFFVGSLFVILRVPRELDEVGRFDDWETVTRLCEGTPLADVSAPDTPVDVPKLRRRAWLNIGVELVVTQGIQVLLVVLAMGAFYVLFGLLVLSEDRMLEWTARDSLHVLARFDVFGSPVVVTGELLRTAGFVAAFSGLQFTVSSLTDETYRHEFFEKAVRETREALAVRALYLASVVRGPESH